MQILAVVVRYKMPLEQSETILGLCQAFRDFPELSPAIRVFVWDNSPEPAVQPRLSIPFQYAYTGENLGVSGAYNRALDIAERDGCPWLLLLDQDTSVSGDYLKRILAYSHSLDTNHSISSIVPFVRSHGELVSPRRIASLNRVLQIDRSFSGPLQANAYAINSASLLRVSSLREIGGFSEEFWLDLSDVYIFQRLHERGKCMYVAGDLEISHSIAGMNFERDMVPERYKTFLAAENAYMEMYQSRFENTVQTARLLLRAIRQLFQYRDKAYAAITWRCFVLKLFLPRSRRLRRWRRYLLHDRQIPSASDRRAALDPWRASGG